MKELSPREHLVLRLLWEGLRQREIARALDTSEKMVQHMSRSLKLKLGGHTSAHVMRRAIEEGLIHP